MVMATDSSRIRAKVTLDRMRDFSQLTRFVKICNEGGIRGRPIVDVSRAFFVELVDAGFSRTYGGRRGVQVRGTQCYLKDQMDGFKIPWRFREPDWVDRACN